MQGEINALAPSGASEMIAHIYSAKNIALEMRALRRAIQNLVDGGEGTRDDKQRVVRDFEDVWLLSGMIEERISMLRDDLSSIERQMFGEDPTLAAAPTALVS